MTGYSETPLLNKLGIKSGAKVLIIGEPTSLWNALGPLPEKVTLKKKTGKEPLDFIHLFVKERNVFEREILILKKALLPNGMIWVSWPKKSSKVASDMDENVIRNFALKNGLVDVKVCAVDEVLVIPVNLILKTKRD